MNGVLEKRRSSFPVGEREREKDERMMKDKDSSSKSKREKMERERERGRENKLGHHRFQEEEALSFFVCSCEARLAKKKM